MIWLYIKSDIKRYFRDKAGIVLSIVFPVVFILILSNAFGSVMNNKFELSPFSIGYTVSQKSPIYGSIGQIKKELKSDKITLVNVNKDEGVRQIAADKLAGFVEFTDTGYKYYKSSDLKLDSSIFESVLQNISYSTGTYTGIYKALSQYGAAAPQQQVQAGGSALFAVKKLHTVPMPSALTYYGIVMIINIICFSVMLAPDMIYTDRRNQVNRRVALTTIKPLAVFTARMLSSVIAGTLQILIGIVASVMLLHVDYGSKFPLVIGIMLLFAVSVNAFGVLIGYLIKNIALTRTLSIGFAWTLNFFGGSYMQYLYIQGTLLDIMKKTPVYYINRSLVELASQGSSSVLPLALAIIGATTAASVVLGVLVYSRREGRLCVN